MGDEEAPPAEPPAESAAEPPAPAEAGSEAPPPEAPSESPPEAPPAEAPPEAAPAEAPPAEAPPEAPPETPPKTPDETSSDVVPDQSQGSLKPKDEGVRATESAMSKPHVRTEEPEAGVEDRGKSSVSRTELGKSASRIASSASLKKSMSVVSEKGRLTSKGKLALGSVLSIKRLDSIEEKGEKGKVARYANSYKLESDNPFNSEKVEKILESVMVELLDNMTYDPVNCSKQAKWAASAIRGKVKELGFDRYKLICIVTIGEKNSQDVLVATRFLWDVDRDRFAKFTLENTNVFGIAQCFGLYYE